MFKDEDRVLTKKQQKLVAKHYEDALRIGSSFKSSVLYDDEKENIAVYGLLKAARKYDENKLDGASFTTYLYRLIMNDLLTGDKGVKDAKTGKYRTIQKRLPKNKVLLESIIERDGDYSAFASMFPVYDKMNELEYNELLTAIRLRLDGKQRFLFDALIDPATAGIKPDQSKRVLKTTLRELAEKTGVTKQLISVELFKIRDVVKHVMENMDNRFFRVNPKETRNG
jgi:RNA polymerase sigma factor (sigma-70 family)